MPDDGVIFSEQSAERIIRAVRRDKRRPLNNVLPWRERRITPSGGNDIAWALTPPQDDMYLPPDVIADCMIAKKPDAEQYGSDQHGYADCFTLSTYCAGLFPNQWYMIHSKSKYFLVGGAWLVLGKADNGCNKGGHFDLKIPSNPAVYVRQVHSPFGDITSGSNVYCGWKAGEDEYVAILESCENT